MEGWDGIEDLKAQYEQASSWLSVMKSPGLCLDYCSWGGIVVLFHQFNASRWWLMLQYFVVLSRSWCQLMIKQRKMAGPKDHSLWLQLLYNVPLFPVLDGMEAALARVPATVVMYNFNVGTRGASKKNFIKCSLKLKFSSEVGLTQSFLLLLSPPCPLYIW